MNNCSSKFASVPQSDKKKLQDGIKISNMYLKLICPTDVKQISFMTGLNFHIIKTRD